MKTRYAFEFCDHAKTPHPIRKTLLEILETCNQQFRPYYQEVSNDILDICDKEGLTSVVELGAGTAPITRELACDSRATNLKLIPCDLYPETQVWEELEKEFPGQVESVSEPVDFLQPRDWPEKSLLVLVAAFHHIPPKLRPLFLKTQSESGERVAVFEPLRKTPFSMALTIFAIFPALLLPILKIRRPGRLRRVLWCWLVPVVPLMFMWDGIVSCLRQWNPEEWEANLQEQLADDHTWAIKAGPHSSVVVW